MDELSIQFRCFCANIYEKKIEGDLKELCKIYSTYMEGESNVNNKPINEIFEDKTSYYC